MIIINSQFNQFNHTDNRRQEPTPAALPEWQQKLHDLVQYYIEQVPAKTLGRELRTFFLLHVSALEAAPPGWEEQVLHMMALLELLDRVEDEGA